MRNTLYYGDNLPILREYIATESVDLVVLDPPFNSNRSYNVLFRHESGTESQAQVEAFADTWHWNQHTEAVYHDLVTQGSPAVSAMIGAMRQFIGDNQMMAYLVMMAVRLVELHRVLKPTGSLYLHCDPTASHYLKVVLDTIFRAGNFQNEIIWKRTTTKNDYRQGALNWARVHDVILHYAKDAAHQEVFNQPFQEYDEHYIETKYPYVDEHGRRYGTWDLTAPGSGMRGHPQYEFLGVTRYWRYNRGKMERLLQEGRIVQNKPGSVPRYKRYLDEMPGVSIGDTWDDIPPINSQAAERLGYPTQKPVALLERIISASSNPGDVVLDPFCGCGTSIAAAEKLERHWIGIDITTLAITLQKNRLRDAFGLEAKRDYDVIGEPADLAGAIQLAQEDRYQFQWWASGIINAQPLGADAGSKQGKKGADRGIDAIKTFIESETGKPKRIVVQVKSGHVNAATVRDLRGVVEREQAAIGVLLTLDAATQPMETEAAKAGFYESVHWGKFPRIQILTVEGLLHGTQRLEMPAQTQTDRTFKQAPKEQKQAKPRQPGLLDDA